MLHAEGFYISGFDLPKPNSVILKKEEASSFEKPKQTYYPVECKHPEQYHLNNNHHESLKTYIRP
jgi:hypothetical protein